MQENTTKAYSQSMVILSERPGSLELIANMFAAEKVPEFQCVPRV